MINNTLTYLFSERKNFLQTSTVIYFLKTADVISSNLSKRIVWRFRTVIAIVVAPYRTLLGHMTASITRVDATTYDLMVFRSMAQTLVHDLTRAMKGIAARHTL